MTDSIEYLRQKIPSPPGKREKGFTDPFPTLPRHAMFRSA
jgi:hypothetical protein